MRSPQLIVPGPLLACPKCSMVGTSGRPNCHSCGHAVAVLPPTESSKDILQPGTSLAHSYTVEELLAVGGFAYVYKVKDESDEVFVAKIPQATFAAKPSFLQSFVREAELWINLGHSQNVVTAHDVRVNDGIPFLIIEYVDGGTLEDRMAQAADMRFVVRTAMDVANGLSLVWRRSGIVHGDVHPGNVLMSRQGDVNMTDFGLAYSFRSHLDAAAGPPLTAAERMQNYLSPEQLLDPVMVDTRSDVYSFGVMLYRLATGRYPFDEIGGGDSREVSRSRKSAIVMPPATRHTGMPAALSELTMQCLEYEPGCRPQDFEAVWNALKSISDSARFTSTYNTHKDRVRRGIEDMVEVFSRTLKGRDEQEGPALQELGRHREALAKFEAALHNRPDEFSTWWNKGNSHAQLGELAEALKAFTRAQTIKPDDPLPSLRIGRCLQRLERWPECQAQYDDYLARTPESDPERSLGLLWRGHVHFQCGRYAQATQDFVAAAKAAGEHEPQPRPEVTSLPALEHAMRVFTSTTDEQLRATDWAQMALCLTEFHHHVEHALTAAPHDPHLLMIKAAAFWLAGRVAEAEPLLREAHAAAPDDIEITQWLIHCLIDLKYYDEAVILLTNFLRASREFVEGALARIDDAKTTNARA
jgi:serine/threonine protein kinase